MVTRRLQYSGALFDGQSADKHLVQIELTPRHVSLKFQGGSSVNWLYSNLRWAAETIPFQIEHEVNTPAGKRLETLVVEDPDFYETVIKLQPKNYLALKTETNLTGKFWIPLYPNSNWEKIKPKD